MQIFIYTVKNILSPIFYKILSISISASIIGIILLITNKIFKNKISNKTKNIIWIIFLVCLIMSPKFENRFSIYNFVNIEKINQLSVNIKFNTLDTYDDFDTTEDYWVNNFKKNISRQVETLELKEKISIFYYLILLFLFLKIEINIFFCLKLIAIEVKPDEEEYKLFEKIKLKLQIKKDIKLVKSKNNYSPCINGVFYPKVFISDKKMSLENLEYLLTHELCHYKRKDNLINSFKNFLKQIYFFNPIIVFCLDVLEQNLEFGADDMALEILGEEKKKKYCLLMTYLSQRQYEYIFDLNFIKQENIEKRVDNILNIKKLKYKRKYIIFLSLILILIFFCCFTKEKIYITDKDLKYLEFSINGIDYKVEQNSGSNENIIICKPSNIIKIEGNENLLSLCLNTTNLETNMENNSTFFFESNDIEINVGDSKGEFLYELKTKYETKQETQYCFIIKIE